MRKATLLKALTLLNDKMAAANVYAELVMFGGAAMCLALGARGQTHDIDAVFTYPEDVRRIALKVAAELGLEDDWLNDGVKGFVSTNHDVALFGRLSNLTIYVAKPAYLLAMKIMASRTESGTDSKDLEFLLRFLGIRSVDQAISVATQYFPLQRIPQRAFYLLTNVLEGLWKI